MKQKETASATEEAGHSISTLTYADVHMILALLRGWDEGAVSLRYNELAVDAVIVSPESSPWAARTDLASQVQIRSPAVGVFTPRASVGTLFKSTEAIGVVDAPGRSTSVFPPMDGKLVHLAVAGGGFVESDNRVAPPEPIAKEWCNAR